MAHTSALSSIFSAHSFNRVQPPSGNNPPPALPRSGAAIDGWQASPNPFAALRPAKRGGDAAEFASSINNTVIRAIEWRDAGKWSIAERHLQSAIWMAIAANDAPACLMAGIKLLECYLGAGDMPSAMNLARQLLPLSAVSQDAQAYVSIATARCMCAAVKRQPDAVRQELAECASAGHGAPADALTDGFDEAVFHRVARMLDRAHERERLAQWRAAWAELSGRESGSARGRLRRLLRANFSRTV